MCQWKRVNMEKGESTTFHLDKKRGLQCFIPYSGGEIFGRPGGVRLPLFGSDDIDSVNRCYPAALGWMGKLSGYHIPRSGFSSEIGRASPMSPAPGSRFWAPGSGSSFDCLASARRAALSFCFCCRAISLCRFSKVNFVLAIACHPLPFMQSGIAANEKKRRPGAILTRRGASSVMT
jgi:hypothetical protein